MKILFSGDMLIETVTEMNTSRPDILVKDKEDITYLFIDMFVPTPSTERNANLETKENLQI